MNATCNVVCLTDRFGNFINGKVYEGRIRSRYSDGRIGDVVIIDEDGDQYVLAKNDKHFQLIGYGAATK